MLLSKASYQSKNRPQDGFLPFVSRLVFLYTHKQTLLVKGRPGPHGPIQHDMTIFTAPAIRFEHSDNDGNIFIIIFKILKYVV